MELLRPVAERDRLPRCKVCGKEMPRALSTLSGVVTWPPAGTPRRFRATGGGLKMPYISAKGETFYSRGELREYCRRHGQRAEVLE